MKSLKHIKLFEDYESNSSANSYEKDILRYQNGILASYLETALWSSHSEEEEDNLNLDEKTIFEFDDEALTRAKADVDLFVAKAGTLLDGLSPKSVGHDFWLTRCGHGAGFWDGDYDEEIGQALTAISKEFGNIDLYIGDDDKVSMV
jgi:hypothetical protein